LIVVAGVPNSLTDYWLHLTQYLRANPTGLYQPKSAEALLAKLESQAFQQHQDSAGHITGSALVLDSSRKFMLLIFHPKLQKWIQPGGHVEAGEYPFQTAERETCEETGLTALRLTTTQPIDVDVHPIPAGKTPAHLHYDLRYLFIYPETVESSREWQAELSCRWVELNEVERLTNEESVLRLLEKARSF
jgi:8-oxo-dGTP pyrophosphatase MutT (NUDIX family)